MILDLMETDLHRIIYSRQALTDSMHNTSLSEILRSLKYLHSNVFHRDLKPSNLLLNGNCDLRCAILAWLGVLKEITWN